MEVKVREGGVVTAAVRGMAEAWALLGKMSNRRDGPGVLERFVLEWATEERVGWPLPDVYRRGLPRQCFKNATDLVWRNGALTYHEGFALAPRCGGFPIHHAWVVTPEGRVVDTTWSDPDECYYLGVPFSRDRVLRATAATECYGVLCPHGMYATDLMAGYAAGDR